MRIKKIKKQSDGTLKTSNSITNVSLEKVATPHKEYPLRLIEWTKIRDCMKGEEVIKSKGEKYLPRPEGMSGIYAKAYTAYKERAHFPLISSYALSGALGIIINKLPEFNVPRQLEYILKNTTKDGRDIRQLFVDIIIEIFSTGRVPITIDIIPETNEFRFVQYSAESLINWKSSIQDTVKSIVMAVIKETQEDSETIFADTESDVYKVLHLEKFIDPNDGVEKDIFKISVFGELGHNGFTREIIPLYMGKHIDEIPIFMAGSINNSFNVQPIPLISVANCSIQIYRKEADLSNSEFLSCNPTLVVTGAVADENIPNVVGSSVMIVIPNEMARVFYTKTDTAALTHVKEHIKELYEEAIRHGISILDARKGVEAAEALRIRQETQSSTLYSVYMSAIHAIESGLKMMCKWANLNPDEVYADSPSTLSFGIPDASLLKELVAGFGESGVVPLEVVHRYMVSSGLLDQTINYEEYIEILAENKKLKSKLGLNKKDVDNNINPSDNENDSDPSKLEDTKDQNFIGDQRGLDHDTKKEV